jgi:hypothetical protein
MSRLARDELLYSIHRNSPTIVGLSAASMKPVLRRIVFLLSNMSRLKDVLGDMALVDSMFRCPTLCTHGETA